MLLALGSAPFYHSCPRNPGSSAAWKFFISPYGIPTSDHNFFISIYKIFGLFLYDSWKFYYWSLPQQPISILAISITYFIYYSFLEASQLSIHPLMSFSPNIIFNIPLPYLSIIEIPTIILSSTTSSDTFIFLKCTKDLYLTSPSL